MNKFLKSDKSWIDGYFDGWESGQKQAFFEIKEYIEEKIKDKLKSIDNQSQKSLT
ncbi:MAG: hypothetical protein WCT77_01025 [Bacteroidota bacterium]|jgi:hypothetical protein